MLRKYLPLLPSPSPKRTKSRKENHERSNVSILKVILIKITLENRNYNIRPKSIKIYSFCKRDTN